MVASEDEHPVEALEPEVADEGLTGHNCESHAGPERESVQGWD